MTARPRGGSKACFAFTLALALLLAAPQTYGDSAKEKWAETLEMVREDFPGVRHISTSKLVDLLVSDAEVTLLDTREREEFEVSHIKGAVLARNGKDAIEALENVDKDELVVVYCSVGYRSSNVASILKRHGYANVFNLEGSIFQWANEGRPVYQGESRVEHVHPYDRNWGQLLQRQYWHE